MREAEKIKWFKISDYDAKFKPNNFFIGARGIGKTYSAFSYVLEEKPTIFIYIRNTIAQLDECCSNFGNPFKKWARDHNRTIYMKKEQSHAVIYEKKEDDIIEIGYGAAISSFDSLRGVDLSDVKIGIFDEFIEKKTLQFDQYRAYDDFWETVNHNRDILGEDPFKIICLSNAQKLSNGILVGKNLVTSIEKMIETGQKSMSTPSCFVCMPVSEVSELKKQSAFYQGMENTRTYKEAIENKFANDSFYGIIKRPLKEYKGLCQIDDIFIYKHKSQAKYYASFSRCTNIPIMTSKNNYSLFYRTYGILLEPAAARGLLEYENFTVKSLLFSILKLK